MGCRGCIRSRVLCWYGYPSSVTLRKEKVAQNLQMLVMYSFRALISNTLLRSVVVLPISLLSKGSKIYSHESDRKGLINAVSVVIVAF